MTHAPDGNNPPPPRPILASTVRTSIRVWRVLQQPYEAGRFVVFLALAGIGLIYALSLLGSGSSGPTWLSGSVNLYTSRPVSQTAVLDIKISPEGKYSLVSIRPAFDVPQGQTIRWAVLASKRLLTGQVPDDAGFALSPSEPGAPAPHARSVKDADGNTYWLFTGVVEGPANELPAERQWQLSGWGSFFFAPPDPSPSQAISEGIVATGRPANPSAAGEFSVVLPGFSNFGPDERAGFSVSPGGRLLYGVGTTAGSSVQWHALDVTTHVELAQDLAGIRLDSIEPPTSQVNPAGLAWDVDPTAIPYGFTVAGADLGQEASAQQRTFFAGVLAALAASALLASFQERPKDLKGAANTLMSAVGDRTRRRQKKAKRSEVPENMSALAGTALKQLRPFRYPAWTRATGFLAASWVVTLPPFLDFAAGLGTAMRTITMVAATLVLGVIATTLIEIVYSRAADPVLRRRSFPVYSAAFSANMASAAPASAGSRARRSRWNVSLVLVLCATYIWLINNFYRYDFPVSLIRVLALMALIYAVVARSGPNTGRKRKKDRGHTEQDPEHTPA